MKGAWFLPDYERSGKQIPLGDQIEVTMTTMAAAHSNPAPLLTEQQGAVRILELNRPARRNALSRELVLELGQELVAAAKDPAVRVILVKGRGGAFCSGADLSGIAEIDPDQIGARIDEFHRIILAISAAEKPVIAALGGAAVGFGADVALACDIRILSESAYLQESFVEIGLMPDGGGTHWAPHFFGGRAFEVLALGQRLSAKDCQELHLSGAPIPDSALDEEALRCAQTLAQKPPLALQGIKAALSAGRRDALQAALAREREGQSQLLRSQDFQEGVRAFLEKRSPQFHGR
jgi:enoyl-CoA hydratase/carnithine racemase